MSEEMIIRHCSPTLAGIKTGNMFSCYFNDRSSLFDQIRTLNKRLSAYGVVCVPLSLKDNRAVIYIYRPSRLSKDITDSLAKKLLCEMSYSISSASGLVAQLSKRMQTENEFPHEVGLFLGYPSEDVLGYITDPRSALYCGHWKVYGNIENAKKIFKRYKKCAAIYDEKYKNGKSIEELTVSSYIRKENKNK